MMTAAFRPLALLSLSITVTALHAQPRSGQEIYMQNCASCHGDRLQGGSAPSMLDDTWRFGGDEATLTRIILKGAVEHAMPAFEGAFSDAEVASLVTYIQEQRARPAMAKVAVSERSDVIKSEQHSFIIETLAEGLDEPWSLTWLPDGRMLLVEKSGALRIMENGRLSATPIRGTPAVFAESQGGMLEVTLHPNYASNGWIYLAFSHRARDSKDREVAMTKIVRGKLRDGAWTDEQEIWTAPLDTYRGGGRHFGCRIAFDKDGYLFFSIGDRGAMNHAQEPERPNGKIHRIHDDGRIPTDNPFVGKAGAIPSLWTLGNRNAQGLTFDPATGILWSTEHGPRGGDELNIIERGRNYGWPLITYGTNYNRTIITKETARPGLEQPVVQWTPSIAVCGIDFYTGGAFPKWKGNLFVAALANKSLRRLVIEGNRVTHQETLLKDISRLRDVGTGPDGYLYLLYSRPGQLVRLVPAP
jgi:aldose sugar dehydrogenase